MVRPFTVCARGGGRRGFTLIELLVVIAIISILASLLLAAVVHGLRIARITKCGNNLREIGMHLTIYSQRYRRYPEGTGAAALNALRTQGKPPVLEDADSLYVCPLTDSAPGPGVCDYRGPREPLSDGRLKHSTPIACDREENHAADASINILYPNGRVERVHSDSGAYQNALDKTAP